MSNRPHLLVVSPEDVWTGRDGLAVYTRQMISAISDAAEVNLVSLSGDGSNSDSGAFSCYHLDAHRNQQISRVRSLFSRLPAYVLEFRRKKILSRLLALIERDPPDRIILNHRRAAWLAPHLARVTDTPITYMCHNAEEKSLASLAELYSSSIMRRLARSEARKTGRVEREVLKTCQSVTCISPEDVVDMGLDPDATSVHVIPVSMRTHSLPTQSTPARSTPTLSTPARLTPTLSAQMQSPGEFSPDHPPTVLLVGSLTWAPKLKNAVWLVNSIFPLIRKEIGDVRLIVAGAGADMLASHVERSDSVELVDSPESLDSFFDQADVFVIPERQEGGLKIKAVEAAAHGLAIVSTSAGMAGTRLTPSESVLIADEAEKFAEKVVILLRDNDLSLAIGSSAREIVREYFDEDVVKAAWVRALLS